jgi:HPt (histidine-containing phosphotransfer) domain-containing protein
VASAEIQIASLVSKRAVRFIHRTLAELPGMRKACAQLCQGDEESLQSLKRWAHKVRGTAATLRLEDVGAQAGQIEDLLACGAEAADRLEAQLAGLEAQLVQRFDEGPRE